MPVTEKTIEEYRDGLRFANQSLAQVGKEVILNLNPEQIKIMCEMVPHNMQYFADAINKQLKPSAEDKDAK